MITRLSTGAIFCLLAATLLQLVSCAGGPSAGGPSVPSGSFSDARERERPAEGGLRFGDNETSNEAIDGLLSRGESAPAVRPKKSRDSRPGLATQAGSERWSEVNDTTFFRKTAGQPDAIDSFYYNDAIGAKAMAEALGGARKKAGTFVAASDRLEVALESEPWGSPFDRFEAAGRRIVIGEAGGAYRLALRNKTNHAIEVVASVDGLDVIDGQAASIGKRGYIVAPRSSLAIDGFRKDRRTVKRFVFGSVDSSLAAQSGKSRNVGVIGLAVYDEDEAQARAARLAEARQRQGATAFPGGRN